MCVLAARNALHNLDGDEADRETCITGAREIAAIIRLWISQIRIDELGQHRNVQTTSTNQHGVAAAEWLVKSVKILRSLGRHQGESLARRLGITAKGMFLDADGCAEDAAMLIEGLKSVGTVHRLA